MRLQLAWTDGAEGRRRRYISVFSQKADIVSIVEKSLRSDGRMPERNKPRPSGGDGAKESAEDGMVWSGLWSGLERREAEKKVQVSDSNVPLKLLSRKISWGWTAPFTASESGQELPMYAVPTYLGTTGRRRQVLLDLWCPCPSCRPSLCGCGGGLQRYLGRQLRQLGGPGQMQRGHGGSRGTLPPALYGKILWVLVSP